jgi:hypothetical protein
MLLHRLRRLRAATPGRARTCGSAARGREYCPQLRLRALFDVRNALTPATPQYVSEYLQSTVAHRQRLHAVFLQ